MSNEVSKSYSTYTTDIGSQQHNLYSWIKVLILSPNPYFVDACHGDPCGGYGECALHEDTFRCNCYHGYGGLLCTQR